MNPNYSANRRIKNRTRRSLANVSFFVAVTVLFVGGCARCCGPYDYHYPNHGGSVQRSDPVWGRVGSVFSDPGPFGGPSADYNLQPHESGTGNDVEDIGDIEALESDDTNSEGSGSSSELPPPSSLQRPGPDDTTSIQRFRTQSQRIQNRWR